jgi:hypothetical protein
MRSNLLKSVALIGLIFGASGALAQTTDNETPLKQRLPNANAQEHSPNAQSGAGKNSEQRASPKRLTPSAQTRSQSEMRKSVQSEDNRQPEQTRKPVQSESQPKVREGDVGSRHETIEQKGTAGSAQKRREYKSGEHPVQTGESDRTNSQPVRRHPAAGAESESHSITPETESEGRTRDQTDFDVIITAREGVRCGIPTDTNSFRRVSDRGLRNDLNAQAGLIPDSAAE